MRNIKITKTYKGTDESKLLASDDHMYLKETEEMESWATSHSIYVTFSIALIGLIGVGYSLIKLIHSILS